MLSASVEPESFVITRMGMSVSEGARKLACGRLTLPDLRSWPPP